MKRVLSIIAAVLCIVMCFAACGQSEKLGKSGERAAYNYDMTEYVTLGKYKGMEIDKSSEVYQNYYDSFYEGDIASAELYQKIETGTVKDGDTVNISYSGKKVSDGKIFTGDTSSEENDGFEDYDLTIGSGAFIDGFEDQLIGAEVGSTVTVKVTFPEGYSEDLSGERADFTVKVNYIRELPEITDDIAKTLGFDSKKAYEKDLQDRVVENVIYETLLSSEDFVIKNYPKEEKAKYDEMYENYVAYAEQQATSYNETYSDSVTTEDMLYYMTGMSQEQFKSYYESALKSELIFYAVFDAEDMYYTTEEYDAGIADMATSEGATADDIKANYDEWVLEANTIKQKAMKFMAENAVIK